MPRLSLSTWSLHRTLGEMYNKRHRLPGPRRDEANPFGELTLLELPAQMAARGIFTLEICHFHLPRLDNGYFAELRASLAAAGVSLFSILIDDGDITHPDMSRQTADLAWIQEWIAIAGCCGAEKVRVIAGMQPPVAANGAIADDPLVQLSARHLLALADIGEAHGVGIITENFHALTATPPPLLAILAQCAGRVGLCADFGNFKGAEKYDDLAAILPYADSVHAKAQVTQPQVMEREDFDRCLDLMAAAHFDGPTSLIFDGPGNEWAHLAWLQEIVTPYCS